MSDESTNLNRKRSCLRFSLRSFFILVLILSIQLGGLTWYWYRAARQHETVKWINENRGLVSYDYEFDSEGKTVDGVVKDPPGFSVHFFSNVVRVVFFSVDDKSLRLDLVPLSSLTKVEFIGISGRSINGLEPLASLRRLRSLSLYDTNVSDLTPLAELPNLEYLNLQDTSVSDLSPIANVATLKELIILGTSVVDLSPLTDLPKLESLYLNTPVTDFESLAKLQDLKQLRIFRNKVDKKQEEKIRVALPKCEIVFLFEYEAAAGEK